MTQQALFEGLIYDVSDQPVEVGRVGGEAQYIIDDAGFRRHIPAEEVDRQVITLFVDQLQDNKDLAVEQALRMMGRDDLLTKAAIDASLRQVSVEDILRQGVPAQARDMLGMMGMRVVINFQGEVVRIDQPAAPADEGWED